MSWIKWLDLVSYLDWLNSLFFQIFSLFKFSSSCTQHHHLRHFSNTGKKTPLIFSNLFTLMFGILITVAMWSKAYICLSRAGHWDWEFRPDSVHGHMCDFLCLTLSVWPVKCQLSTVAGAIFNLTLHCRTAFSHSHEKVVPSMGQWCPIHLLKVK